MTIPNYIVLIISLAFLAVVAVGTFAGVIGKVDRKYR